MKTIKFKKFKTYFGDPPREHLLEVEMNEFLKNIKYNNFVFSITLNRWRIGIFYLEDDDDNNDNHIRGGQIM